MPQQLWDISPPIHDASPVFPGDTPYSQQWCATISPQCPVNVSAITLSPHVGAHADAPLHYAADGAAIGAVDLDPFLGPCRVIHAIAPGPLLLWQHIEHAITPDLPARVLVRTYAQAPTGWDGDLAAYAPETVERIQRLLYNSEYKRRQAPPIIRVRAKAFGSGRQMPIAARYI